MTSLPKMMIACRVSAFGPPSAIAFEQIPVPTPGEGEALVRVHAAASAHGMAGSVQARARYHSPSR